MCRVIPGQHARRVIRTNSKAPPDIDGAFGVRGICVRLSDQQEPARLDEVAPAASILSFRLQPVEIHAARQIPGIELHFMITSIHVAIDEPSNLLTESVENRQGHL